ncbi:hypothetical protein K1719_026599 [Acacia pycnantha]|nr:hypothetical protein K1719_026599 [Acacia pycnantha]
MLILAETKTNKEAPFKPLLGWGFDSSFFIPNEGQSGGMAVFWQTNSISVNILAVDRQFLHMECAVQGIISY